MKALFVLCPKRYLQTVENSKKPTPSLKSSNSSEVPLALRHGHVVSSLEEHICQRVVMYLTVCCRLHQVDVNLDKLSSPPGFGCVAPLTLTPPTSSVTTR
ncbi:hypothetical protein RR46_00071 [Papilio xuthus]|uniref:Uncharacterized protein n=1 Tax=Papilio xuthus TaxID=66420 RepID=A0A0N1IHI9_PAPXU|nr:hypothetical protein RR46_00071 [Papilio xuthus]